MSNSQLITSHVIACYISLLIIIAPSFASDSSPTFEIGTWGNFCKCAYTHTFDDNTPNQTAVAQPLFDAKNFNMTLFTITDNSQFPADWEALKNARKKGHEIASHSVTHQRGMSVGELAPSQTTIRKKIPGEQCITIAYPYCMKPNEKEVAKYYIGGRVCDNKIEATTPDNFFEISSFLCGSGNLTGADAFNRKAEEAEAVNGWCVLLHHGVGNGDHISCNTAVADIRDNIEYLDAHRDRIWVESFDNVIRYIKERNSARIVTIDRSSITMKIRIIDSLPDSIYNYPLSIRCVLPEGWMDIAVTQAYEPVEDTIVTVIDKRFIVFKAVPDAGDIIISNGAVFNREKSSLKKRSSGSIEIRRLENSVIICMGTIRYPEGTIIISDLLGKTVLRHTITRSEIRFELPSEILSGSMLIIQVKCVSFSTCRVLKPFFK